MELPSDSQYAVAAADSARTGAHGLEDRARIERVDERVELLAAAGQLDRVRVVRNIDDASAEYVRHALDVVALLRPGAHLDQHQLALDVLGFRQVADLDDVDQLVQLLRDLLDHVVRAAGDDR